MEECIFVSKPEECSICLRPRKLMCLYNKRHLIVRDAAKKELIAILTESIEHEDRYKTVSGKKGRTQ